MTRQPWLRHRDVPFAAFGRRFADGEVGSWVDVDGAAGVAAAVRHLAALGHRRIAFIGWPEGSGVGDDRYRGCVEAAAGSDLDIVAVERSDNSIERRSRGGRRACSPPPDAPPALVCVSDVLALGCDAAVRSAGLVPGRDIAITGFDDSPAAGLAAVSLTSVRQPLDEAGEHVVRLLVDQLAGRRCRGRADPARARRS